MLGCYDFLYIGFACQALVMLRCVNPPTLFGVSDPPLPPPPPPVAGKIRSYVACARGMIVSPKVVRAGGMFPSLMIHTHTRTRTHARTHARKHARTHARRQTQAERERERETERTKGTQTGCQAIHTHTKYTNKQNALFLFNFRIIRETPKGAGDCWGIPKQFLLAY